MNCEVLELPLLTVEHYQLRETLRCAHPALPPHHPQSFQADPSFHPTTHTLPLAEALAAGYADRPRCVTEPWGGLLLLLLRRRAAHYPVQPRVGPRAAM